MICEFCGGTTETRRVKKHHWLHGKLYLIENVKAEVCRECGERYFHASTLDAIDHLLEAEHPVKRSLRVEVVSI